MACPIRVANDLRILASRIERTAAPSRLLVAEEVGRVLVNVEMAEEEAPEGPAACPQGELIAHLQKWLGTKYAIDASYRSFADRVRGPWRDALVDHWHEHAKEERQHSYDLAMRIVGLGADPIQTYVQIPQAPASLEAFSRILMNMEMEAIAAGRATISMAGDMTSLKVLAENFILTDTQHLDDLRRMAAT